jgi:hypothetical protein
MELILLLGLLQKKKNHGKRASPVRQNVMAACSRMMFIFVNSGWEGITNDSFAFMDALSS